jgi:hypothetical protein
MTKQQKVDIKAMEQTLLMLSQNGTELALLPNATAHIAIINDSLGDLYTIDTEMQGLSKIKSIGKTKIRLKLSEATIELANRGVVYADDHQNNVLSQKLNSSISTLKKMPEMAFRDYAQMINDTITAEIANIPPTYLITAAAMTAQQGLIDDFSNEMPGANNLISRIKMLTTNFANTLATAKASAKKLDTLVNMLCYSHPIFYKTYNSARKPQKVATTVRAIVFTILDKTTNAPIYKATATFVSQKTQKSISRSTTENGTITIPTLAEGVYEGSITEAG